MNNIQRIYKLESNIEILVKQFAFLEKESDKLFDYFNNKYPDEMTKYLKEIKCKI